ncbi:MAG TPA: dTDP-4-dehydrorhamnose 3,5-epimerase [Gemmataceae bacterium]|nr:dTDP-4-dehydrorhamnose 3,5-epimerase [Gemmataceae bacterium]
MQFHETRLRGAFLIDLDRREDERGHFARTYCEDEFAAVGLRPRWLQCNVSFNRRRGTLRGLHYQEAPFAEAKLVRCTRGAIFDVIVDLRPGSPTYGKWVAAELTADNGRMFYVPEGFAHGFQTLADDTEVFYQMSERYRPEAARGVRWDDAALAIAWPDCGERIISPRDLAFPGLPPCRPS